MRIALSCLLAATTVLATAASDSSAVTPYIDALSRMDPDNAVFAVVLDGLLQAKCGHPTTVDQLMAAQRIHTRGTETTLSFEVRLALHEGRTRDAQRAIASITCDRS